MRQRRARLVRAIELFEVAKRATKARIAQLTKESALLDLQEEKQVLLLRATTFDPFTQRLAMQAFPRIAGRRREIARAIEKETGELLSAERRIRAAARVVKRLQKQIEDLEERQRLEELRLTPPSDPASHKASFPTIGPLGAGR